VGVTADNKYFWIGEAPTPWLYISQQQDPGIRSTLLLASSGDAASLAAPLRDVVRQLESNMPMSGVRTMEEFYYGNAVSIVLAMTRVTGSMGITGTVLAMVGLYGLVAYVVARRTREIGIRIAVGATPATVLRSVLRHGLVLALCGIALGVVGCVAAGSLVRSVFPASGTIDVTTYALVISILVAVTLLAAYIPARRAARIDPLRALKTE
jgi:ABC-type antimicrobial peptide transport system permease subunit